MVLNYKVYKKCSPNGKITLYMGKREFVDHISTVEAIEGVVVVDEEYARGRSVFGQLVCTFRYGREEDEVMGLNFYKELFLASEKVYPAREGEGEKRAFEPSRLQQRLAKKLGAGAVPFRLPVPAGAPGSVTLQQALEDDGEPCGVHYYVKVFLGESEIDRSHRRSTVALGVRKLQFAPSSALAADAPQPCTVVRKEFVLSPGQLELEVTLERQVYLHGETLPVHVCVRNRSSKPVKKLKASVLQAVDVVLFGHGQYRTAVAQLESADGCPLAPGASLQRTLLLTPLRANARHARGLALDAQLKRHDAAPLLASTTLLLDPEQRDAFGIIVSYGVRVKLYLGALAGELVAELPFILMHPKEGRVKEMPEESDRLLLRHDTAAAILHQESVEVY